LAAPALDYLDSMMWSIAASGVILGVAALRLRYKASSDSIDEEQRNLASGLGVALGATGFYLFITSIAISFGIFPQFTPPSARFNILFGGVGALGGLVLLSVAAALFLRRGLQACSYFAAVVGVYLISDAYSIWTYGMTSDPTKATLVYLAPAVALLLSPFAVHIQNKWSRYIWAIFAFLFAAAWLYFAATTTPSHLHP
jgi:uncharacterized membrane protein